MPTFDRMIKDMETTESNGFPTKRNHADNQQNYIPSGEKGGEYTFDGATFKEGDEEVSPSSKAAGDSREPKDGIKVTQGDGKPINKDFDSYIDSQNFRQDFKEQLKNDYSLASKDFQDTLSAYVKRGDISIKRTSGLDCCEMRGILNISEQTGNENRIKGEVFWHETCHGLDFQSLKDIPANLMQNQQYASFSTALRGFASASASTRYITSTGKTMLQTLTDEITSLKRDGRWKQIAADYRSELNAELKNKFPDIDIDNLDETRREEINKIDAQINEEFKGVEWGTPRYDEKWKRRLELVEANQTIQKIDSVSYEKCKIANEKFKKWGAASDMYVAGGGESFCGGHSAGYFRKDKANKALEFFAEYGSAVAINDKPVLDNFKKYFPETSKAAEEVIEAIHKYTKGRKK